MHNAAVLVVGSGREGDELDEDPPLNGLILLGWHGVDDNSGGERDGNENRSLEQRRARARAFDIAATCRPGLSFHRENGGNCRKITLCIYCLPLVIYLSSNEK